PGRARANRTAGESAAPVAAAAGAPGGGAADPRTGAACRTAGGAGGPSGGFARRRPEGGSRIAGIAGGTVRGARTGAGADAGSQRVAHQVAGGPGHAGVYGSPATGSTRQGLGQGDAMVEGAIARPSAARRAAAACRSRLGEGGGDR